MELYSTTMDCSLAEMTCVLKVNTECEACKAKVMRIFHNIRGLYNFTIDGEEGTVKVTGRVNPKKVLGVLEKFAKHAEVKYVKFNGEVVERRTHPPYYHREFGYAPPYGMQPSYPQLPYYPQHQCYQASLPPSPLPYPPLLLPPARLSLPPPSHQPLASLYYPCPPLNRLVGPPPLEPYLKPPNPASGGKIPAKNKPEAQKNQCKIM